MSHELYPSLQDILDSGMKVIRMGHDADLRFESNGVRLWVHRTGLADGEPYENTVTAEVLLESNQEQYWHSIGTYDGDDPPEEVSGLTFEQIFNLVGNPTLDNLTVLLDDTPLSYEVIVLGDGSIAIKTDIWKDEAGFLHTERNTNDNN